MVSRTGIKESVSASPCTLFLPTFYWNFCRSTGCLCGGAFPCRCCQPLLPVTPLSSVFIAPFPGWYLCCNIFSFLWWSLFVCLFIYLLIYFYWLFFSGLKIPEKNSVLFVLCFPWDFAGLDLRNL